MVANSSSGDWLASLARQSASSDNKVSNSRVGGGSKKTTTPQLILSKAQRIERREQKRAQREERKLLAEEARQQRQKKKKKRKRSSDDVVVKNDNTAGDDGGGRGRAEKRRNYVGGGGSMTFMSKRALTQLSSTLHATVSSYAQQRQRPKTTKLLSNNNIPKGKATKRSTLRPTSKELQPRTRDYNGQGLARPSLFLPLNDPSFIPKLELEFSEHIEGFFGRSKTKAVKRQMVKDEEKMMLWQKRLAAKKKGRG